MPYQSFESLEVWKRSSRAAVQIYQGLAKCRDFGLKDQMTRAAVSVPSNIADGYERGSNKEFVRFLNIAKGSAAELRTQLADTRPRLPLIPDEACHPFHGKAATLASCLMTHLNVQRR